MRKGTEAMLLAGLIWHFALVGCDDDTESVRRPAPGEPISSSAGAAARPSATGSSTADGGEPSETATAGASSGVGGVPGKEPVLGTELRIDVVADEPTLVRLSTAREVQVDGDQEASSDWDLAFRGWDIFTNGGSSGTGNAAAFGPLPFTYWAAAEDPTGIPFLIEDKAAGAFLDWYLYDGQWHALYSRFHRYGVQSGGRLFKLQLLGYYGEVQGAPISALYRLRYAEVTADGSGPVTTVENLDATAGGLGADGSEPSMCLSLGSGERQALTPPAALEASSWDLCFRRDAISVNGGLGGPGDVAAVDLDATDTEGETLDAARLLTPESEAAAFDAIDYEALTAPGLTYRGDRIVSAFSEAWFDRTTEPATLPRDATWLVVGADGQSRYLLAFTGLEHPTAEAAGKVVMRIQQVR